VRAGRLRPTELVQAHIDRVQRVNPLLNAMVADRFDAALAEARAAEVRLKQGGELPPFLGVPCTIKEFFAVTGLPKTGGMLSRRDSRPEQDATTVARLREAGFIVLGVTNAPEGGLWMETTNLVYGRTNNPWDLRRTCGGSSGGEGALVAAGASPVGLGSDIGGSIRIPAGMCGTVGHKPSGGLVPNTGQFPDILDDTSAFLGSGPLTRRVADLYPLLKLLAGPDGLDPACRSMELRDPASVDLSTLGLLPLESNGRVRVAESMRLGVRQAAQALEDRGAHRRSAELAGFRHGFEIWSAMLSQASSLPYARILGQGKEISVVRELARHLTGHPRYSLDALIVTASEGLAELLPGLKRRYLEEGRVLRQRMDQVLGDDTVLIHPVYSRPAPRHRDAWRTPFDSACTSVFNVMQCAVTVVPTGFDSRGLPVCVQLVARQGQDHLAIAAAAAVEQALGGWQLAEPRPLAHSETWGQVQSVRVAEGREAWPPR